MLYSRFLICLAGYLLILGACVTPSVLEKDSHIADSMVESLNISKTEAMRRLEVINLASSIADSIGDTDPERFGGVFVNHEPVFEVVFRLTGNLDTIPAELQENPEFRVLPAVASLEGLAAVKTQIVEALDNSGAPWTAAVDPRLGKVAVVIQPNDTQRAALHRLDLDDELVDIEEHPMPAARQGTVKGGGETCLEHSLSGGGSAKEFGSLAFNVRRQDGLVGVISAAHVGECKPPSGKTYKSCVLNAPYEATAANVKLTHVSQELSPGIDVEFRTGPGNNSFPNTIRVGPKNGMSDIEITDAQEPSTYPPLTLICKQGRSTFRTCGFIQDLTATVDFNDGIGSQMFVSVTELGGGTMSAGGDSGGSVYVDNTAVGVLVGGKGPSGSTNAHTMYFMSIGKISILGVSVLTQPY